MGSSRSDSAAGLPPELVAARRAAVLAVARGAAATTETIRGRATHGQYFVSHPSILTKMAKAVTMLEKGASTAEAARVYGLSSAHALHGTLARYGFRVGALRPRRAADMTLRRRGTKLGSARELVEGLPREQADWIMDQIPAGVTLVGYLRALMIDLYYEENGDA